MAQSHHEIYCKLFTMAALQSKVAAAVAACSQADPKQENLPSFASGIQTCFFVAHEDESSMDLRASALTRRWRKTASLMVVGGVTKLADAMTLLSAEATLVEQSVI